MKIIVIGAGAAGLMAARLMAEGNHEVVVLEARDRTGGRIHTQQLNFSMPVEMGAEFMHGMQPVTLSLMNEANVRHTLLSGNRYQVWNGQLAQGDFFGPDWERLTQALEKLTRDIPLKEFLERNFQDAAYEGLREKVRGFVEGYDAADMGRVSSMALAKEWSESDDEHQYHIEGGYSNITEFLAQRIRKAGGEIRLSSVVREIEWKQNDVKIFLGSGGEVQAEKVIVAIPLGALQRRTLKFSPPLPGHNKAFDQMGFGGVIKFFVEFKTRFWEDRISRPLEKASFVFSDAAIPTWWSQLPDETPLLTGWLGGPGAAAMHRDGNRLYRTMVDALRYVFGCESSLIENEMAEWHVADWLNDPYTFGAYSYPTIDTPHARSLLMTPVKDTVYFSGEHLYSGSAMGTVEAALVNGKEVAERLMH